MLCAVSCEELCQKWLLNFGWAPRNEFAYTYMWARIGYDREAVYVTFNSTLRLKEATTGPPLSERSVEGVLMSSQMYIDENVMVCHNTIDKFTTSIIGDRTFPPLSTNAKHTPVILTRNVVEGHIVSNEQKP